MPRERERKRENFTVFSPAAAVAAVETAAAGGGAFCSSLFCARSKRNVEISVVIFHYASSSVVARVVGYTSASNSSVRTRATRARLKPPPPPLFGFRLCLARVRFDACLKRAIADARVVGVVVSCTVYLFFRRLFPHTHTHTTAAAAVVVVVVLREKLIWCF